MKTDITLGQNEVWISVKNKKDLPKTRDMVIVSNGKKTWGAYFDKKNGWVMTYAFWWYGDVPFRAENITHWMRRPSLPRSR